MSSLFKQTTGISLSSVLGGNNNTIANSSTSTSKIQHPVKNVPNSTSQVKNFADKLKFQQHQYAVNTNNYLKTIDNCLEEASRTGELLLSTKSLVEFPSTIALRYDLTDTLLVDLSKNRLHHLPKDILRYKPLEKLILNSNIIQSIPDIGLTQLRCLKTLDLNCNRLAYLPASVCNLVSLEILTVNNNKLVSLPEEIGRLDKLIQLDVSCNEITHLPLQIGEMVSMRALNVRRNLLVELPKEISQLKLVSFDCSSNRINKLPLCFREMVTLIDLTVENNPLQLPPAHVCTKGLLHIMKYLLVETIKEEKKRGVLLSEYDINHQFSQLTTGNSNNSNNNVDRRESCNSSTTGLGSIGSFIFQSSVKNMNKAYNTDIISTQSTTASSSASTVSTSSSSVSTTSSNQLKSAAPKSLSTTLLAPATQKGAFQFINEQSMSKQNLFISSDTGNDFVDAPSMSSSSSPSSTTSSSPPATPVTGQSIVTTSKHVVSIHDLISPTSLKTNTSKFQNSNFINYNQSNEFIVDGEESPGQQIWRTNEIAAGRSYIKQKPIVKQIPSVSNNTSCSEMHYDLYAGQQTINQSTSLFRRSSQSLKTPAKPSSIQHTSSTPKSLNQDTNQIVYDEFLNPIVVNSSQTTTTTISPPEPYQYQQQQMIWVPREDIKLAEPMPMHTTNTTYNANQHKPQYQVSSQQNVLTLPSGRDLPSDMKSVVDPAFTIRRHFVQIQQDNKQVETLRKIIDSKLNIQIPLTTSVEELGLMLSDGVILCHLMNQMFPRAVQAIIAPSINIPKLSVAKCRKNIESFIEACHQVGLDEVDMCCVNDILEGKNTSKVAKTVVTLANYSQYCQQQQHLHDNQYGQINQSFDHIRQQQQQQQSGTGACLTLQQQQQTAV